MKLPLLVEKKTGETLTRSDCNSGERCSSCVLFHRNGGRCEGCTPLHREGFERVFQNFKSCYQECNSCTGYEVRVPAICCRSPLKDVYLAAVTKGVADPNKPQYTFRDRPKLNFKSKSVFMISSGGVNTIAPGDELLVPEGTESVAVNMTRVWGSNGWFSRDLKDYLHLPAKTKLILMTMTRDDLLERAWDLEFYADPTEMEKVGLNAWMPLSFSTYLEQAHMHQYYQTCRTYYCTERSEAWFASGDHVFPGLRTDDMILEAVKHIPQIIFSPEASIRAGEGYLKQVNVPFAAGTHLNAVLHLHKILPPHVAFWFAGAGAMKPSYMATVRKMVGARDLYWVSPRPFYLSTKGHRIDTYGRSVPCNLPKLELVAENIKTHTAMVKEYG